MKIFYSIEEYAAKGYRSRVALGYFDGVHAGHRAVVEACRCHNTGEKAVVLTFRESPAAALGFAAPPALTDNARKAELLEQAGADAVIFADFGALRELSPADFVRRVLVEQLRAAAVSCGYNYRFGSKGAGDTALLTELCAAEGIAIHVAEPVFRDGEAVSSTRIRELLSSGELRRANRMLGYAYAIGGDVGSGNRIGTTLGFPTLNIPIGEGLCVPRYGVYAARVTVDGASYRGATNIGVHPTVEIIERPLCETFLIDYAGGDLYGAHAVCELLDFIRPERRFDSPAALREQVMRDIERVKRETE